METGQPISVEDRVVAYMQAARELAGGGEALARLLTPWLGKTYSKKAVGNWTTGTSEHRNPPGGDVLFAVALAFPQLSLDLYARGTASVLQELVTAGAPLVLQELADQRRRLEALEAQVAKDAASDSVHKEKLTS